MSDVVTPIEKNERTVNVQGIATHIFEAGSPVAPPLLYLHGTTYLKLVHLSLRLYCISTAPTWGTCGWIIIVPSPNTFTCSHPISLVLV